MRVLRGGVVLAAILVALFVAVGSVRAEYVVLQSGQRLVVTGYQIIGDKYRLQMNGGFVDVPVSEVVAIEPEEVFTPNPPPPKPSALGANAQFSQFIQSAATRFHVDADLISSVIAIESNYNPNAISRRNARGLMQLIPGTAFRLGVHNAFDPRENIDAGTRYLGELLHRYDNNLILALAAYNAGPQNVQKYGAVPPFPETVSYVRRVKNSYDKRKAPLPSPAITLPLLPPVSPRLTPGSMGSASEPKPNTPAPDTSSSN